MNNTEYQIEGLTIAIYNMDEMLAFYSNVFSISFEEKEMFGSKLYEGHWGSLKLLFCPAALAGIDVDRNRQQFDIKVLNINSVIETAMQFKGRKMGEIQETSDLKSHAIFDPDGNSIVFKEYKNRT